MRGMCYPHRFDPRVINYTVEHHRSSLVSCVTIGLVRIDICSFPLCPVVLSTICLLGFLPAVSHICPTQFSHILIHHWPFHACCSGRLFPQECLLLLTLCTQGIPLVCADRYFLCQLAQMLQQAWKAQS